MRNLGLHVVSVEVVTARGHVNDDKLFCLLSIFLYI